MILKIWLDDVRPMPNNFTHHAKNSADAVEFIICNNYSLDEISFDHDLGGRDTGYIVACFIERIVQEGKMITMPIWHIHSANPVGRERIYAAMRAAAGRINDNNYYKRQL
jgi:hypothetical protein